MANFYKNFASETLMSFGKSFARLNGQPLDKSAIWYSKAEADAYAATGSAYVGQPVAVIDETAGKTTLYVVGAAGNLEMVGSLPDGLSLELHEGKVQLKGFDEAGAGSQLRKNADGELEWFVPSTDTVDGLQSTVGGLQSDMETVQADIDELQEAMGNVYNKEEADAKAQEIADAKDDAIAAAKKAGDDAQDAVDALAEKIGEVAEGKTVVKMIEDAQAAATYDDTELANRVTAAEGEIDDLQEGLANVYTKTEADDAIATAKQEAIDAILGEAGIDEKYDTLREVADWILSDTTSSSQLITRVTAIEEDYLKKADKEALQGAIDDLEDFVGALPEGAASETVVAYIHEVVDALQIGDYAKLADLNDLAARVLSLEGKAHEHENEAVLNGITAEKVAAWDAAEQNAKDHADAGLSGKVDVEEGKSLISDTLIAKIEGIDAGAQVNVVDTVDEAQFGIEGKHLTLLDIAMGKVTGLQSALDGKADKGTTLEAYGITDAYTKTETLDKIAEKITEINGGESAGEVLSQLNSYKETNDARVEAAEENIAKKVNAEEGKSLVSDTLIAKLEAIEANAQVNKIEAVKVGSTVLDIVEKAVVIPVGAGLKASEEITVAEDGTLGVGQVGVGKLVNDGTELILNGGAAK